MTQALSWSHISPCRQHDAQHQPVQQLQQLLLMLLMMLLLPASFNALMMHAAHLAGISSQRWILESSYCGRQASQRFPRLSTLIMPLALRIVHPQL
jgi:hypothetical protein